MDQFLQLIQAFDQNVNYWATTIRTPTLDTIMYWATVIGRFWPMVFLSTLLFFLLLLKKKKEFIAPFFIAMPGGYGIMSLLKYLIGRPRPQDAVLKVHGYSFPSGHAMMSTIFFLFLLIAFYNDIRNSFLRFLFLLVTISAPLLISFSRIYFNVHWATDVIGGIIFGLTWLAISLSMK